MLAAVHERPYRLLFQVMLGTGKRVSEVLAMRVCDSDRERPLIRVPCGKGGDARLVRLEQTLRDRLRSYGSTYRPTDIFFQRRPGQGSEPMLAATVNAALQRAAERSGFGDHVSSHPLRHTFAIHSLRGGMDVVYRSRQMGHRCLLSTLRYVTSDLERPGVAVDVLAALGVQS